MNAAKIDPTKILGHIKKIKPNTLYSVQFVLNLLPFSHPSSHIT